MLCKRTVWVLDIHEYLDYLNAVLDQLIPSFPWLGDQQPINGHWHWKDASRIDLEKTQREALIDWILAEEFSQLFYLTPKEHSRGSLEFEQIYNRLVCEFSLNQYTTSYLIIPKIYSDIHTGSLKRQAYWLYLECDIYDDNYKQHVIPATSNTRNKT